MLSDILAQANPPLRPEDLAGAWNLDPVLITGLLLAAWAYRRGGGRAVDRWRARCFAAALAAIVVALISPLEAMSGALASAHMVQHVLLILVAAPLLALSAPSSALLRGTPPALRRASGRWRRRLGLTHARLTGLRHPVAVWLLHVATLWFWHARVLYDAALTNELVHITEHVTFLATAVAFWHVVMGARGAGRVSPGLGVMLVFGMAVQSIFLSVLLVFARTPWYAGYATTTDAWGLDQLADQQLAGAIMWVPAGFIYVVTGVTLMAVWLRAVERQGTEL